MIRHRYLEVTYLQGKPLAAYLYMPRKAGDMSCRTQQFEPGILIDFAADGRAIGVEITSPQTVNLERVNRALASANQEPIVAKDLAPLLAA